MKWSYVLVADAASVGPGGKVNALGLGVRIIKPGRLPSITPLHLLAAAEARPHEVGEHAVKVSIQEPGGRPVVLLEDKVTVQERPAEESSLPMEVRIQVGFPFLARTSGLHILRLQLGQRRVAYPVLVVGGNEAPDEKEVEVGSTTD